jgi:hypothetical protein
LGLQGVGINSSDCISPSSIAKTLLELDNFGRGDNRRELLNLVFGHPKAIGVIVEGMLRNWLGFLRGGTQSPS